LFSPCPKVTPLGKTQTLKAGNRLMDYRFAILISITRINKMKKYIYGIVGLLLLAGVVWLIVTPGKPGKYDDFAKCIKEKGVIYYGAFWCPHCKAQGARFGKSVKYLPYVECSTSDGKGQLPVCIDAGIQTYPTWQFGTTTDRYVGEMELVDLAAKTSCVLPQ